MRNRLTTNNSDSNNLTKLTLSLVWQSRLEAG